MSECNNKPTIFADENAKDDLLLKAVNCMAAGVCRFPVMSQKSKQTAITVYTKINKGSFLSLACLKFCLNHSSGYWKVC